MVSVRFFSVQMGSDPHSGGEFHGTKPAQKFLMILRSAFTRTILFLSAPVIAAQAHPGHPGHDNDPYRMDGLVVPFPELGFLLPLVTLGVCLALMRGKQRMVLSVLVVALLVVTGAYHAQNGKALVGLLASAACALAAGAIPARAAMEVCRTVASRNKT